MDLQIEVKYSEKEYCKLGDLKEGEWFVFRDNVEEGEAVPGDVFIKLKNIKKRKKDDNFCEVLRVVDSTVDFEEGDLDVITDLDISMKVGVNI